MNRIIGGSREEENKIRGYELIFCGWVGGYGDVGGGGSGGSARGFGETG